MVDLHKKEDIIMVVKRQPVCIHLTERLSVTVTFERVACKRVTYLTIIGLVMSLTFDLFTSTY